MPGELSPVRVVCAVIERNGHVLVAQRPGHKHLPFKWEFPGGKVELHESPAAALLREIDEELACQLTALQPLPPSLHDYGTFRIKMLPFVAQLQPGSPEPRAREHVSILWVHPAELDGLDWAPADLPVIDAYRAALARRKVG